MKKWIKYFTPVLIAFFIFSGICKAEPDSTIKYLMNEPVSMLDWGLLRLEQYLNQSFSPSIKANYHKGINRIYIKYDSCDYGPEEDYSFNSSAKAKLHCENMTKLIKANINSVPDPRNIKIKGLSFPLKFDNFFRPSVNYKSKNEPTDLAEKLMAITEIHVVTYHGIAPFPVQCMSPLLGKDIYFKE